MNIIRSKALELLKGKPIGQSRYEQANSVWTYAEIVNACEVLLLGRGCGTYCREVAAEFAALSLNQD